MDKEKSKSKTYEPIVLVVLDGFGVSNEKFGNPILDAEKPNLNLIEKKYPFTTLQASGVAVGLPWGEAGNSEVGHLTIGAGRIVYHHLPRIVFAIHEGLFFKNEAFLGATEHVRKNNSNLHLVGLVSSGSVHSYIDHIYALLEFVNLEKLPRVYLHIFTDGKDAPPNEGGKFIRILEERLQKLHPSVHIASVIGRTYAMDRDERWEQIRKTYRLLTEGEGSPIVNAGAYIRDSYKKEIYDAFIEPAFVHDGNNNPIGNIQDNDAVIFFNFREDSIRELTSVFGKDVFDYFPRKKIDNLYLVTMTEYDKNISAHVAFPPIEINWPLARIIGEAGKRQLHIAETEKYAHITYFFNGGVEKHFPREEWELIPSLPTAKYNEHPEMRAKEITDYVLSTLSLYSFVLINFANADMVGHTGNYEAVKAAIQILDQEIGRLKNGVLEHGGVMLITGDHGNAEVKISHFTSEISTEHTISPTPLYCIGADFELPRERSTSEITKERKQIGGILTDVAPTILELLGLQKPDEMTGKSLLPLFKKQIEKGS